MSLLESIKSGDALQVILKLQNVNLDMPHTELEGLTPLSFAAWKGSPHIVEAMVLLEADIEVKNHSGKTPLHIAAQGNRPDIVELLIDIGANVYAKDNEGNTPLHIFTPGDGSCVEMLTKAGICVNSRNIFGETPLHRASKKTCTSSTNVLLGCGADVNATTISHCTPLHYVTMYGGHLSGLQTSLLIKHSAEVNVQDQWGKTPLHYASQHRLFDCAKVLLQEGASSELLDDKGKKAWDYAVLSKMREVLEKKE